MECIILVRTNINYDELNADQFAHQAIRWGNLSGPPMIQKHLLEVWQDIFFVNYFDYRSRLKAIAESNLRFVANKNTNVRIIFGLFDEFESFMNDNNDAWIIPIDDDDWLHPDVIDSINLTEPFTTLVRWGDYWWDLMRNKTIHHEAYRRHHYLGSNNWAIRKSVLRQYELPEAAIALSNHIVAWKHFCKPYKEPPGVQTLERCLSLYLFHIGSLTNISRDTFPREFLTKMSKIIIDVELPDPMQWAQPWADQYSILYDEMTMRIRLL